MIPSSPNRAPTAGEDVAQRWDRFPWSDTGATPPPPPSPPPGGRPPPKVLRPSPPAPTRALVLVVLGAAALDIAVRVPWASAAATVFLLISIGLVVAVRRPTRAVDLVSIALAAGSAGLLMVRASVWVSSMATAAALAILALLAADALRPAQTRPWLRTTADALDSGVDLFPWLLRMLRAVNTRRFGLSVATLRTAIVVIFIAVGLGGLLASGDVVFASVVTLVELNPVLAHVPLTVMMMVPPACLTLMALRSTPEPMSATGGDSRWGQESRGALWTVALVLGSWGVVQLVVIGGGADRVLESEGLTAAEYARQGFFQLVAAAAVSLAVLNGAHRFGRRGLAPDRGQRLPALVIGLALSALIVATFSRLWFYVDAFGLTMLRLSVATSLIWLAVMTLLSVARSLGFCYRENWLPAAAVLSAAALALVFGLVNPEARIAEYNLGRAEHGAEVDLVYLFTLSEDVRPVLAGHDWTRQAAGRPAELDFWLCSPPAPSGYGPLGWNRSRATVLDVLC